MCVLKQLESAKWGEGWSVLGLRLPFCIFFLLDLGNIENGRGLQGSLGSSLWRIETQLSLRIGMSAGGGVGSLRKELWRNCGEGGGGGLGCGPVATQGGVCARACMCFFWGVTPM